MGNSDGNGGCHPWRRKGAWMHGGINECKGGKGETVREKKWKLLKTSGIVVGEGR